MPNAAMRTFIAAAILVLSAPVFALPQRVFVASTGLDTNPCSITQPCRGFATAIAAVAPSGEVIALDSAGYGPVTIDTAVSIIAPAGVYAGITVTGDAGVTVAAGGSDRVVLRGLSINGQGGGYGVRVSSGKEIAVEDCHIGNVSTGGILVEGGTATHIARTSIRGIGAFGIWASPSSPVNFTLTIVDSDLSDIFQVGVYIDPVVPGSVVNASATRVTSSHNGGQGFSVFTNNVATATLAVIDSVGNDNGGVGISVSGTNAIAVVSGSSFVGNTSFDLFAGTGGVLRTSVNNSVTGRGAADISGALTTNSLK
jgi:hypothetical protein